MKFLDALVSAALALAATAQAQTPDTARKKIPGELSTDRTLETPTLPVKTLPLELLSAQPNNVCCNVIYRRAGLKPSHYRVGGDAQLTGAQWQSFTDNVTNTSVQNGRTVTTGTLPNMSLPAKLTCGQGTSPRRIWLQLRITQLGGKHITSAIRGDSTCVAMPG